MNKTVVTGGAGFIGTNLAYHLLRSGNGPVVIYDNLSRRGVEHNLRWLQSLGSSRLRFVRGDVRDRGALAKAVAGASRVFHLAAQVAVTTSILNPVEDFEINALGTLYVLEACRLSCPTAVLIFSSTNKVYGELLHVKLRSGETRYIMPGKGISEEENLDFHSPYGCAKGAADQYVRDYHRIYGLKTVVFRQSCIYGPRQYGNEDQGWVAHFIIKALSGEPLAVYGDGKQVRDVLEVSDLVRAYLLAVRGISRSAGQVYNIGGGPENAFSLLELIRLLELRLGTRISVEFKSWRPGDQKVFVSDNRKIGRELGWKVRVGAEAGVLRLIEWVRANRDEIQNVRRQTT